jgi:hypothetical protein
MPERIELLKIRDFGEIITDTLVFAKENFKPLFKSFFVFSGVFLFIGALLLAFQQTRTLSGFNFINLRESQNLYGQEGPFAIFTPTYFLGIFFSVFGYISLNVTILSYIAIYKQKGNQPAALEEVWGYFKYFFWRAIGSGILTFLLLLVATLCCFFPGIYLYPIMSLVIPIIVFENASFGYAFNKSFKLISNNWWLTFGVIFVIGLIVGFASAIINVPIAVISMVNIFTHIGKGSEVSVLLSVLTAVCQLVSHVLYVLPIIAISLCYFNLSEQLDGTGLIARINQIGIKSIDNNLPGEEH